MNNLDTENIKTNTMSSIENAQPVIIKDVDKKEKKVKKSKKKKGRDRCCFKGCKKALNLATVTCKCNKRFCALHRLQAQHDCEVINTIDKEKLMQQFGLGGGDFKKLQVI
tara:strand:+ start:2775 stop:3104 length:330 start_codon:yes stop_codon:yes gene_type:complete